MLTSISPAPRAVPEMKSSVLNEWMESQRRKKCWRENDRELRFTVEYFSQLHVCMPDRYTRGVQNASISSLHNPYSVSF